MTGAGQQTLDLLFQFWLQAEQPRLGRPQLVSEFSAPGGSVQAVATVSGDEMAGEGRANVTGFQAMFKLNLSRQPEGQSR